MEKKLISILKNARFSGKGRQSLHRILVGAYHAAGGGGGVKEFSVLDVEGLEKKVSFTLHGGQPFLHTEFGPSSAVLTPIAKRTRSRLKM